MPAWRLLFTPPAHGAWNMAADEAILEHIGRGESPTTLRLFAWDPPCLSLGHAQPYRDIDITRLKERGWEVVRRLTGGRAILHTDELTYSVTGSVEESVLSGSVLNSYNQLARALLYAVKTLGLPVEMNQHEVETPTQNLNPVCFEVPSTYEITVHGKKLIGSAQARRREGILQHGSVPLKGDLARICQALTFQQQSDRDLASARLLDRATTVEAALGREVHWEEAAQALVRGFEAELGIQFKGGEMSPSEIERTKELIHEKYAHPSWTERC